MVRPTLLITVPTGKLTVELSWLVTAKVPVGDGPHEVVLSADGKTFTSTIDYSAFDPQGKPVEGGGKATGTGQRTTF